jgi:hypothetical protein
MDSSKGKGRGGRLSLPGEEEEDDEGTGRESPRSEGRVSGPNEDGSDGGEREARDAARRNRPRHGSRSRSSGRGGSERTVQGAARASRQAARPSRGARQAVAARGRGGNLREAVASSGSRGPASPRRRRSPSGSGRRRHGAASAASEGAPPSEPSDDGEQEDEEAEEDDEGPSGPKRAKAKKPKERPSAEAVAALARWGGELKEGEELPRLVDFAKVFLAYGAEVADRSGRGLPPGHRLDGDYVSKMDEKQRAQFRSSKLRRCTFSFLTDTSTMNLASKLRDVEGPDMLYNSLVAHFILNSKSDFNGFEGPFSLARPLIPAVMDDTEFVRRWRELHAPPAAAAAVKRGGEEGEAEAEAAPVTSGRRRKGAAAATAVAAVAAPPVDMKLSVSRAIGSSVKDTICHCRPLQDELGMPIEDLGKMTRDMPTFVRQLGEPSGAAPDAPKRLRDIWRGFEDAVNEGGSAKQVSDEVLHVLTKGSKAWGNPLLRSKKGKKEELGARGLPPFGAYVAIRFVSIFYPQLCDWNTLEIGQYAVQGLLELIGISEKQAGLLSKNLGKEPERQVKSIFLRIVSRLPEVIHDLGGDDLVRILDSMGLFPLVAVNVEHMLCEFRKVNQDRLCKGSEEPRKGGTPPEAYRAMWAGVEDIYAGHAKLWKTITGAPVVQSDHLLRIERAPLEAADASAAGAAGRRSPEGSQARSPSLPRTGAGGGRRPGSGGSAGDRSVRPGTPPQAVAASAEPLPQASSGDCGTPACQVRRSTWKATKSGARGPSAEAIIPPPAGAG